MGAARTHSGLRGDARRLVGITWQIWPRRVAAQVALLMCVAVVGGANLLLLVPVVNALADPSGSGAIDVPALGRVDLSWAPLPALLGGVVALTAVQALIQRASAVNAQVLQESVTEHLRTRTFSAVLAARWSFILDRQRSDIIATVADGSRRAGYALGQMLTGAVTSVVALVTAGVALVVEPVLSAVAIAGTAVLGAVLSTSIRRAYGIGDRFSRSDREVLGVMTDSLDSFRLVRAHDAADVWRRELGGAFDEARAVQTAYVRHTATLSAVSQVGLVASAAGLVLVAVWLAVPAATIVIVLLLIARLARLVQQLASTAQLTAYGLPAVGDIEALTRDARAAAEFPEEGVPEPARPARRRARGRRRRDQVDLRQPSGPERAAGPDDLPAAPTLPGGAAPPGTGGHTGSSPDGTLHLPDLPTARPSGSQSPSRARSRTGDPLVALRGVSFHYPASGGGVADITLEVPTGQMTALTGPSGAGKSTIADIVLGLLGPDTGTVLIDGQPLSHAELRAWRSRVAYVPQETVLVPGSLRKNLLWSVGDAGDDACWRALDRAAATFAQSLPDGLDTELGDRGIRLSGGERQRVAIARALLRQPDLLVLDEATSSLDDATESAILDTIASLRPEVTVLVIAHRRSTIVAADSVVKVDRGRVATIAATLW